MKFGISRFNTRIGFGLHLSYHLVVKLSEQIVGYGFDQSKRRKDRIDYSISLNLDAHSIEENPELWVRGTITLRKTPETEYYFSFPVEPIMEAPDPLAAWLRMVFAAIRVIEKKAKVTFLALKDEDRFLHELLEEFHSDEKYKFVPTPSHDGLKLNIVF